MNPQRSIAHYLPSLNSANVMNWLAGRVGCTGRPNVSRMTFRVDSVYFFEPIQTPVKGGSR